MAAKRTGRVSVARVIDEWGDHQSLNPRSLAFELADALRSMSQPGATVPTDKALIMGFADQEDAAELTWYALADYFDGFGSGSAPSRISTTNGECIPSALLLDRGWIDRLTAEAVARAEIAAGYAQALPHEPETIGSSALAYQHPAAPSGSDPECLAIREAQQRQEGEASAVEQLDAARSARRAAEQEAERLRLQATALAAQLTEARTEAQLATRALNEQRRECLNLKQKLSENAGIIEFMNPDNELSPVEGRRVVDAWCELTKNGTVDAVSEHGIGIGELAKRWWESRFGAPAAIVVKRLQWALTWPARKNGGVPSKRSHQKG